MGFTAIMDYGVGNLKSISNAFRYLGLRTEITSDKNILERADSIVLPGVGAFPDAAEKLRQSGLDRVMIQCAAQKPLLGICLGMQLLFDQSEEGRKTDGLGLIGGSVTRIQTQLKLPHIGWNPLHFTRESPLFRGIPDGSAVYFVHSYAAQVGTSADLLATTNHGAEITAAVGHETVFGCQFHPEKSGETGLQIIKNFGEMNR